MGLAPNQCKYFCCAAAKKIVRAKLALLESLVGCGIKLDTEGGGALCTGIAITALAVWICAVLTAIKAWHVDQKLRQCMHGCGLAYRLAITCEYAFFTQRMVA